MKILCNQIQILFARCDSQCRFYLFFYSNRYHHSNFYTKSLSLLRLCLDLSANLFTGGVGWEVCFIQGEGVCIIWGGRGVCIQGVGLGRHPLIGYYGIRSMSGWYASYWNAFLFDIFLIINCITRKPVGFMQSCCFVFVGIVSTYK